jgi:sterol desaturase/sphingolipid hydroxylase (fatty acid hydroxylase superfamily)
LTTPPQIGKHVASRSTREPGVTFSKLLWLGFGWCIPLIAAGIATIVVYLYRERPRSLRGFLRFCMPPDFWSKWTLIDLGYVLADKLLRPLTIAPFLISVASVALLTEDVLRYWLGPPHYDGPVRFGAALVMTLLGALVADFAIFVVHVAFHKIPILWELHKTHHSVVVMTPISMRRQHPLDVIAQALLTSLLVGPLAGGFAYYYAQPVDWVLIWGFDVYIVLNCLTFSYLKHSHIWITFGPVLGRIAISPAAHQVHHSFDPRHLDKNFGQNFAWWDSLYGTLCLPGKVRDFPVGLSNGEHLEYDSVLKLFLLPMKKIWRMVRAAPLAVDNLGDRA